MPTETLIPERIVKAISTIRQIFPSEEDYISPFEMYAIAAEFGNPSLGICSQARTGSAVMRENGSWPFYVCSPRGLILYDVTMPSSQEMVTLTAEFRKLDQQANPIPEIGKVIQIDPDQIDIANKIKAKVDIMEKKEPTEKYVIRPFCQHPAKAGLGLVY